MDRKKSGSGWRRERRRSRGAADGMATRSMLKMQLQALSYKPQEKSIHAPSCFLAACRLQLAASILLVGVYGTTPEGDGDRRFPHDPPHRADVAR
ncbi:hypothetical protein PRJ_5015 [Pseudomonas sp. XWY-1]|nr:hypothetical protein PRJ_5015 [Pseudomonas sp. XWY-1]